MVLVQPIKIAALFFRMTWKHTGPRTAFSTLRSTRSQRSGGRWLKEKALLMKVRAEPRSGHLSLQPPFQSSPPHHGLTLLLTQLLTLRTVPFVNFIRMSDLCSADLPSDLGVRGEAGSHCCPASPLCSKPWPPSKVTAQGFKGPAPFPHPCQLHTSFPPFWEPGIVYSKTTAHVEIRK